ncbi:MAG TPA: hypothetical protein VJ045_08565 [Hyphomicrobiaceae bacterium]|nr:hypothetical protein [Hyphomicrobiaceae bacterium]
MTKSEVYSWRLSPELKAELEAAARRKKVAMSVVLERAARDWLRKEAPRNDAADQERRRAALMACAGAVSGDGTSATNAVVRQVIGDALERKYGRRRPR